jgi:uncharacterized caspase-like protein
MLPSLARLVAILLFASCASLKAAEGLELKNPDGGTIRALVIGIDRYEHVIPLKGAVADARDIEAALSKGGVNDIRTLIDADASRSNILQTFSDLVQRTGPNDLIILSVAGHGSQEPERVKGSEPDGLEDVFLLPGFEPTPSGSQQRILGSEFNHLIRQFELKGAKVLFVADTCHGGGMTRDIDRRASEMSFRQVPSYRIALDMLAPVTEQSELASDLGLDHTVFFGAVDRQTKAPEVSIPGITGLRGALSYAIARAFEGNADADHDGKITVTELFSNVRQIVYQLSDQRQNIVTTAPPGGDEDRNVIFQVTRGIGPQTPSETKRVANTTLPVSTNPVGSTSTNDVRTAALQTDAPIRLAALDGKHEYFDKLVPRGTKFQIVQPIDNPDLLWDPLSHDVIAWGDVVAYKVDHDDLASVVDRTSAIRALKRISTKAPQPVRIAPDDRLQHRDQRISVELSDVAGRSVVLFNVSGDGTIQLLYPIRSDAERSPTASLSLPLRIKGPFGSEQVVAITSDSPLADLKEAVGKMNGTRASDLLVKTVLRYMPQDSRVGSVGFYTQP